MLIEHRLLICGRLASCRCGEWEFAVSTGAGESTVMDIQVQFFLHAHANPASELGLAKGDRIVQLGTEPVGLATC